MKLLLDKKYKDYFKYEKFNIGMPKKIHIVKMKSGYLRAVIQMGHKKQTFCRAIMEVEIGRKLSPKEIVHHKNGNSLDNRIKNLEITTQSEHMRHHFLTDGNPLEGILGKDHPRWAREEIVCDNCGKVLLEISSRIKLKHHFCDMKCMSAFYRARSTFECPICKNKFYIPPSTRKNGRKYCNLICFRESRGRKK